jgi:histidinol dehydrogenase
MIQIIRQTDHEKRQQLLERLRQRSVGVDQKVLSAVAEIISDVRERGDEALVEYAERFDGVRLDVADLRVSAATLSEAADRVDDKVLDAIREAINNVWTFHARQKEESWVISKDESYWIGQRINPIAKVGLYVPGGTAAYPSSVIMNVVPAKIAGVERIVVATPPGTIERNPAVAAALHQLGVEEIYAIGGAQAIAALAYGTETVLRVDKITGPGNKYVAAAKKLVFGDVGIDAIAGPTEVVIVADDSARADFVAADLLAQAEHGEDASSLLLTTSESLAELVVQEVEQQVEMLPRHEIVKASLAQYGGILLFDDLVSACELANALAPEHVEIMTRENEDVGKRIRHAGAIFFGAFSPEALGDYFAGPNHVLPTGGTARFSSGLGVYDFITRTNFVGYSPAELDRAADKIAALAEAEGLQAHARSALIRRKVD